MLMLPFLQQNTTVTQLSHYIQLFNSMYDHVFWHQDERRALKTSFVVAELIN